MKSSMRLVLILLACVAAGAGIYYSYLKPAPVQPVLPPPPKIAPPAPPAAPPAPSFNLEQSDDPVREMARNLSSDPKLIQWLKSENIIRRITAATTIIADGNTPRKSLDLLAPERRFSVMSKKGKIYLNPKSYARYDTVANVIQSL